MKKVLYFDCFSGISGDMTIAALIDLGIDKDAFKAELSKLNVDGFSVEFSRTEKSGIGAQDVDVILTNGEFDDSHEHHHHHDHCHDHNGHSHEHHHTHVHRNISDVYAIIDNSSISESAKELSKNKISVNSVKKAVKCGMPTIAECGGFMYLCRSVENDEGVFEMCGIIETDVKKGQKLGNFGYVSLKSKEESVFGDSGTELRGHEFHYYTAEDEGNGFMAQKPMSNKKWCCVHCSKNLYAGFPHIYFHSNLSALKTFIEKCADFEKREI